MSSYQSGGGRSQELQKFSHSIGTNIQKISQNGKNNVTNYFYLMFYLIDVILRYINLLVEIPLKIRGRNML